MIWLEGQYDSWFSLRKKGEDSMEDCLMDRLRVVFSQAEMNRLSIDLDGKDEIRITADVHGMTCYEAKRFLRNIINMLRIAFKLTVIHGYRHGTAIKEMLVNSFSSNRVSRIVGIPYNLGRTEMVITI